jgi:hypothetical protein
VLRRARIFFLFARSQRPVKAWELHSKARYVQVLAPFCRYLNDLGEERVEILGRKEMGILRRAELEGLRLRLRSPFRSACVGEKMEILAPAEAGACRTLLGFWASRSNCYIKA